MKDIYFSTESFICIGLEAALFVGLPVILALVWRKKTHSPLKPMITGAVTFLLFALVLKAVPVYLLMGMDSSVSRTINGDPLLYGAVAGILAGIFEETGRLLAFKTVLKKNDNKQTSITYGIGHGGIECLYIGLSVLSFITIGMIVNEQGIAALSEGMTADQTETMITQIRDFAGINAGTVFAAVIERASAVMLHIGLSIMVFASVHNKKQWYLYPVAILLHTLVDFSVVALRNVMNIYLIEALFIMEATIILVCVYKLIYRADKSVVRS